MPFADEPGSPPLPGRKATEDEDDDDLSIMSEELEEDPEAEPADGEGEDDDEDGQRWGCYSWRSIKVCCASWIGSRRRAKG